jgi:SAM-dependent methyltransferase
MASNERVASASDRVADPCVEGGFDASRLSVLRCPVTGGELRAEDSRLVGQAGHVYNVSPSGIPLFAAEFCSEDARIQEAHYEGLAARYVESLTYPHTQEYVRYADQVFFDVMGQESLGDLAEICSGRGEALELLRGRFESGVGVDVSVSMLEAGIENARSDGNLLVQGDATQLPLADAQFETVVMLGGIHHVRDRDALFSEVARVLKPGGRFLFREPVSDFWLWRALRAVIYRLSPVLDDETERPLLYRETEPPLRRAGLQLERWRTFGFLGFCFFMNSDVLVFNRLFRFIPGIRRITRAAAQLDELTGRLPGLKHAGLQVMGVAIKPPI